MALPVLIEDKDKICRIQVRDVVKKNGQLTKCFAVKGDVVRDFYLSNIKLQNLIKKRQGVDVPTIHLMLGNKTLETTQRLIETDTISMLAVADMAF